MKRSRRASVNRTYNDIADLHTKIPREEVDKMLAEFLAAGGKVYKSERGRRKGKLTKKQTAEYNKEVLSKQKELRKANEETDRKTDEDGEQGHNRDKATPSE